MAIASNHYNQMYSILKKYHFEDYKQELELSKLLGEGKNERRRRLYALARGLGYRLKSGQWFKEFASLDEILENFEEDNN